MISIANTKRIAAALVTAAAVCSVAPASLAIAVPVDAPGVAQSTSSDDPASRDVVAPDARDRAEGYEPTPDVNLSSPDTRDNAQGYQPELAPESASVTSPLASTSSGFDLVSAAIGLAAGAGLLIAFVAFGPGLSGAGFGGHGRVQA